MNPITANYQKCLFLYIGQDGNLWAQSADGALQYQIATGGSGPAPPAGVPEAPATGGPYERQDSAWVDAAVHKSGDTMSGQLIINGAEGLSTNGNVRLTGRGNVLQVDTAISFVSVQTDGSIGWSLGWAGLPNVSLRPDTTTGDLMLSVGDNMGLSIFDQGGNKTALRINANGDLIATALIGANAGKSVNLTAGKWA